jgi:hypothetical protein
VHTASSLVGHFNMYAKNTVEPDEFLTTQPAPQAVLRRNSIRVFSRSKLHTKRIFRPHKTWLSGAFRPFSEPASPCHTTGCTSLLRHVHPISLTPSMTKTRCLTERHHEQVSFSSTKPTHPEQKTCPSCPMAEEGTRNGNRTSDDDGKPYTSPSGSPSHPLAHLHPRECSFCFVKIPSQP